MIDITIWYVLFGLLLVAVIYGFLYRLGTRELRKNYEGLYNELKLYVENCKVNHTTKSVIELAFKEINKFSCRNREKLDVLWRQYKRKFKKI